jgi:protein-disulfide isomerase-like protein with CxxC motif
LAADFGFDPAEFEAVFAAAATREETRADFALGKRIGIGGFPALLAGGGDDAYSIVTLGYQPWGKIEPLVTSWLEHVAGTTAR